MSATDQMEILTGAQEWLDLGDGEAAIARMKLETRPSMKLPDAILLIDPDWDLMAVTIDGSQGDREAAVRRLAGLRHGARIELVVRRGEDGPYSTLADLAAARNMEP